MKISRLVLLVIVCAVAPLAHAEEHALHTFDRQELTNIYFSEGANAGDFNNDGQMDVVHGPYWFEGPKFDKKHEIFPAKPQNVNGYANHFFSWVYDFDGDGWQDTFAVGFPGTPAYVYRNPGRDGADSHWEKHQVFDSVSNESPHFTQLVGDERPELVCARQGHFGYATVDWEKPFEEWTFHPISGPDTDKQFGHGLGVGDVNGDGRLDVIAKTGWYEQPETLADDQRWKFHPVTFATRGGAEMYAYDVDGDGDNDIITSLEAHEFGLAWYEQVREGDEISFKQHLIMGSRPEENRYGVLFTEPHSVALADIDGDGLKDIVTGKTYWSHHRQSPLWDAGAVVYWFRLVRGKDGVDWVPYLASGESGIGRQVTVIDLDGDKLLDIVVGGMKGCNVLTHQKKAVSADEWQAAQPKPYDGPSTKLERGPQSELDAKTGRVDGALEGETMKVIASTAGKVGQQQMNGFPADRWSGGEQLFWTGAKPGARLDLELPVEKAGTYAIEGVLTMAGDYAIVKLSLDDQPLGEALDLFDRDVITTGVLTLGERELAAGPHKLSIEIVGAHPAAKPAYLVGLDYIRLRPAR
ncbi:MAG: VCBS repeat-containing protein [Pirellulales bacterium]|nr:VCBS repeat-containing protein [Pirellulales bacterium]